jgi:hypothetical protein
MMATRVKWEYTSDRVKASFSEVAESKSAAIAH